MEPFEIKTAEQAIEAYIERFGGWPSYLMDGADEKAVLYEVRRALRTGVEIQQDNQGGVY